MKKKDKDSSKKCVDDKENKIKEKTKENKASPRAYILFHKGQIWAKETCSKMKQKQFATTDMMWE